MKLLQSFVVTGLLAGTACQQIPPKPENVSVETGSLASTPLTGTVIDTPAAPQLDPVLWSLKEQLSLTEQQTQELNKIFKETGAKEDALRKELRDLDTKREERINAILTQEQRAKYERKNEEFPEHPGQPEP